MALPRDGKPAEALRRRNRPESWTVLPAAGCERRPPAWPLGKASADERELWVRLWKLPVAAWWHEIKLEPSVPARYVRLALAKPEHASVSRLESELGLTPAAMARLRLVVEEPEPEPDAGPDPYAHLKQRRSKDG